MFAKHMLMGTGGAGGSISYNWLDGKDATSGSTSTFTGVNLGTPVAGRILVISTGGHRSSNRSVNSMTVAGSAANKITENVSNRNSGLWYIEDAVSTSGTIILNWSGSVTRGFISVWELFNVGTPAPVYSDNGDPFVYSGNTPAVLIGASQGDYGNGATSISGFVEDYHGIVSNDYEHMAGSLLLLSGPSPSPLGFSGDSTNCIAVWT